MLWVKVFHMLFVTAWMVGLFYLPRIMVHYTAGLVAGEDVRRLVIMAEKLFNFTTLMALPAMAFGIWLWLGYGFSGNWLNLKFFFVFLLLAYHFQCFKYLSRMKSDQPIPSSLFFRFFNEVTLLIFVPILILVILKPFQ